MNADELARLIELGESLAAEFKGEERQGLSDAELVEAVVCLANRPGTDPAWLLVGVEDDGRVTGARARHAERTDPPGCRRSWRIGRGRRSRGESSW